MKFLLHFLLVKEVDMIGNTITTEELYGQPNQYQVPPEFLALIILPLSLTSTSLAVVFKKKTAIQYSFNKILQKIPTKAQKLSRQTFLDRLLIEFRKLIRFPSSI